MNFLLKFLIIILNFVRNSSKMSEKKKFENSLKLLRLSLLYSGINTTSTISNSLIEVFVNSFLYYTNIITLYSVIYGEIMWLIHGMQNGRSFVELSLVLPLITISIMSTVKAYNLYLNRKIVCDIIDTLKDIHPEEETNDSLDQNIQRNIEEEITNESVTILNTVLKIIISISGSVLIMFCLSPVITMGFEYFTKGETGILYPFAVEYWFDIHNSKLWPVWYLHQVIATVIVCTNLFGSEIFFYVICVYIEMHFRILCHRLEGLQLVSSRQLREDLVSAVLKHQQLIFIVKKADKLLSKPALFHIVSSSFLICLSAFNITVTDDLKTQFAFVTFLLQSMSQVALLCFFGDKLMKSSTEVSGAVYKCPWYSFDVQTKKAVLIIIMRARNPCKMTAANFAVLNLMTFTTILSRSWSYFALLRSVYK